MLGFIKFTLLFAIFAITLLKCDSSRILGFFPSDSKSHLIVHMATIRPMIERGHDVTIVTTIPVNEPDLKFRHIQLDRQEEEEPRNFNESMNIFKLIMHVTSAMFKESNETLNDPKMQKLMKEDQFDLILMEYFFNDYVIGIGGHFKCPIIVNWMGAPIRNLANFVGNPAEVFYVPALLSGLQQPMGFFDVVKNVLFTIVEIIVLQLLEYQMQVYYDYNFPPDKNYPSYDEMKKNISMLFVNSFLNQGHIQPNVPALVQIGGIQVKPKPDPLPEDIKKHLDSASGHGAIYFCLGTNLSPSDLSAEFVEKIFKVLSSLKQKVIWKWDIDTIPGNSSNILYKKWLPQDDILAHPNVKLFVTHGGAGGVAEALNHGLPMIGIPFFADQFTNIENVVNQGFGIGLDRETLTEEVFRDQVLEVLNNPKYRENTQRFSKIFRDRPQSARDTAAYWMEYVIRHRGAKHLQSPAVHMNAIQYYGLDVIGFLLAVAYVSIKVVKFLCRITVCKLLRKIRGKGAVKQKIQ